MNAGGRLALYGAGLVVAFGGAFAIAGAVVPDSVVTAWAGDSETNTHSEGDVGTDELAGLSLDADGYVMSPIDAPAAVGDTGEFSFRILDRAGAPVTEFTTAHEKDLHLIAVRTDGTQFRHVHPALDERTGTWSLPWTWDEAGTYRAYADFTPGGDDASGITLTRAVEVAGDYAPVGTAPARTDEVGGYTVTVEGDLVVGASSELTISVARDGAPVTTLQPYLGAFGHLVALREGDLAYLHVHAEGADPQPGQTAGPAIAFAAQAPTAGRYLLYLDFQVDGQVHTAEFVLDAEHADGAGTQTHEETHSGGH